MPPPGWTCDLVQLVSSWLISFVWRGHVKHLLLNYLETCKTHSLPRTIHRAHSLYSAWRAAITQPVVVVPWTQQFTFVYHVDQRLPCEPHIVKLTHENLCIPSTQTFLHFLSEAGNVPIQFIEIHPIHPIQPLVFGNKFNVTIRSEWAETQPPGSPPISFSRAFGTHDRFSRAIRHIPVHWIMDPDPNF